MQETWVLSLCLEDPLEKEMITHLDILAWEIPWIEGPRGLQSMDLQKTGQDLVMKEEWKVKVKLLSLVRPFATPQIAPCQASLSITNSQSSLKLMAIKLVMPSNHLILCCPLLLPSSIFPSFGVFSNEPVLPIRWPKDWDFSFTISPINIQDWFPLGWTGWISLQSKGLLRAFFNTTV